MMLNAASTAREVRRVASRLVFLSCRRLRLREKWSALDSSSFFFLAMRLAALAFPLAMVH